VGPAEPRLVRHVAELSTDLEVSPAAAAAVPATSPPLRAPTRARRVRRTSVCPDPREVRPEGVVHGPAEKGTQNGSDARRRSRGGNSRGIGNDGQSAPRRWWLQVTRWILRLSRFVRARRDAR
jgi:hypothetical protein